MIKTSSKKIFAGTFVTEVSLFAKQGKEGMYAFLDVDNGDDVIMYIWDNSNNNWVKPISDNSVGVLELKPELKTTFEVVSSSIDWNLGIACYYEMTADTDFTLDNMIENKVMTFNLKGEHAFTINESVLNPSEFSSYDGTKWNLFSFLQTTQGIFITLIKEE